jgi:hypothetical protein
MAESERKYQGGLTLGKLEQALEAHEMLFGFLVKIETLGTFTVATYDDKNGYPPLATLALLPMIGGVAAPAPQGSSHLLNGEAVVLSTKMDIAAYRT